MRSTQRQTHPAKTEAVPSPLAKGAHHKIQLDTDLYSQAYSISGRAEVGPAALETGSLINNTPTSLILYIVGDLLALHCSATK